MATAIRDDGHMARVSTAAVVLPAAASQMWFIALPPFLPAIAETIGVSPAVAGQIVGLPVLLAAALMLVIGPLIDTYGHARVMMLGLAAIAVSSLGTALASGAGMLLAARLIGSIGRASVIPSAFVDAVERPSQDQQRRGSSWVVAGAASAPLIGVPVLTLVGGQTGWRAAFILVGALAALSAVPVWRDARNQSRATSRPSSSTLRRFRAPLFEPATRAVLLSSLVGNAGIWVCLTYLGVLYQVRLGLGAEDVGWALTAIGLGQVVGSVAAMDRHIGRASCGLLAACRTGFGLLVALPFLVSVGATGVMALLFGGGLMLGVIPAITPLILSRQSRSDSGTVQSLNWLAYTAGIALGASIGGALLAAGDLPLVGFGTLALSLLAAVVLFWRPSAKLTPATQYDQP